jgi:hypothetical protein
VVAARCRLCGAERDFAGDPDVSIGALHRAALATHKRRQRQVVAIKRALEPLVATPAHRPAAQATNQPNLGELDGPERSEESEESFLTSRAPQTRDKVARFAGVSGWTIEKAEAVVEAAEQFWPCEHPRTPANTYAPRPRSRPRCLVCHRGRARALARASYAHHAEARRLAAREAYRRQAPEARERAREAYARNRDAVLARRRDYEARNRDTIAARRRESTARRRDEINARRRARGAAAQEHYVK